MSDCSMFTVKCSLFMIFYSLLALFCWLFNPNIKNQICKFAWLTLAAGEMTATSKKNLIIIASRPLVHNILQSN